MSCNESVKFRAWKKEVGMVYQDERGLGDFFDHKIHPYESWMIMQYSGIKDTTETDLYEGDIILAKRFEEDPERFKAVVTFNWGCFRETHFNDALCNLKCVNKNPNLLLPHFSCF